MKSFKPIITILILVFIISNTSAQNKTAKDIEKAGEVAQKTKETVEKTGKFLKSILGEKKEADNETTKNQPISNPEEKPVEQTGKTNNATQLKAGSIHPDAVVLDVDELYPFHNGAAIVKKGTSTALINAKGEIIVPFNKFKSPFDNVRSKNGFFFFSFDHKGIYTLEAGYISVASPTNIHDRQYLQYYESNKPNTLFLIDRLGKKYQIVYDLSESTNKRSNYKMDVKLSDGLLAIIKNDKWGFKNINDKIIVNPIYDYVQPYSNGAAVIGKINEFGELKYGYIDTQGNPITPIQYSRRPEDFTWDHARVYHNGFNNKYSFINKKGNVVFTEDKSRFNMICEGIALSENGQDFWKTNGERFNLLQIAEKSGLSKQELYGYPKNVVGNLKLQLNTMNGSFSGENDGMPFKFEISFQGKDLTLKKGIMDIEKKTIFYTNNLYFYSGYEKKSKLILAKILGQSSSQPQGYINEEGIFMIVKGEKSKW